MREISVIFMKKIGPHKTNEKENDLRKIMMLAAILAMTVVFAASPVLASDDFSQDNFQAADSGDLSQSFDVVGGGDNSNQCVGGQVVGNTGNAQNQVSLDLTGDQSLGLDEDLLDTLVDEDLSNDQFDTLVDLFEDLSDNASDLSDLDLNQDASIDVSPTNTTTCDQAVNQAATAV